MTITLTDNKGHFLSPTFITWLAQQIFIEYLLGAGENAVNNIMKISAFRDVMYSMVIMVNNTVLHILKVAKRVNFRSSHHTKKALYLCMAMDVN